MPRKWSAGSVLRRSAARLCAGSAQAVHKGKTGAGFDLHSARTPAAAVAGA
jgi:hypothetical protein